MARKPYQVYLDELLSAYLDGELSPSAREELEARLEFDSGLQGHVDELRHVVELLRSMPQEEVPRNFLVTPSMVAPERTQRETQTTLWGTFSGRWAAPVLTFATAVSAFVCAVALLANLSLDRMGGLYSAREPAPDFRAAMEQPVEEAVPEAPADTLDAYEQEEMAEGALEDDGESGLSAAETAVITPVVALPMEASEGVTVTIAPGELFAGSPPISTTVEPTSEPERDAPAEEPAEIGYAVSTPTPGQDEWEDRSAPPPTAEALVVRPAGIEFTWVVVVGLGLLTGGLAIVTALAWRARGR